jgi:exonuclease VII large subunit
MRVKRVSEESARFLEEVKKSVHRAVSEVSRVADENYRVTFLETRRAADLVTSGVDGHAGEISRSVLRMSCLADESSDFSLRDTISSMVNLLDEGEAESDRYLKDLEYFALRSVEIAEQGFKDIMSGIVAMGVEPTLNRGFTIVYSEGKPVTTRKEAEKHHALEICFKDGRLNVTKSDK